jgi:hypothetical protein
MKKVDISFLIFLLTFLFISTHSPVLASLTNNKYSFDLDVNEFRAYPVNTNYTHTYLSLTITCQDCRINLVIVNESNFNIFSVDGNYEYLYQKLNISQIEEEIDLQKSELFYIIVQNNVNTRIFNVQIEYGLQIKEFNFFTAYTIVFLIIISNLLAISLIIYQNNTKKSKTNANEPDS